MHLIISISYFASHSMDPMDLCSNMNITFNALFGTFSLLLKPVATNHQPTDIDTYRASIAAKNKQTNVH